MRRTHGITRGSTLFALLVAFAWAATIAHAERPIAVGSMEGICDALSDATPSLEALCVNYCEARDCVNSDDPECGLLLDNYYRHRRDGDPEMPCLATCPCFSASDLRNHPADLTRCVQQQTTVRNTIMMDDSGTLGAYGGVNLVRNFHLCGYVVDRDLIRLLPVRREEAAVCGSLIAREIAERGMVCEDIF